jgi:radical SAM-linked protein
VSEVVQRWRLVFGRDDEARFLSHLDAVRLWERAFRRGGIPVATSEGFSPRPKLIFAAPLQLGMLAEHELADLFLAERLTAPDLRARLAAGMPRGYRVVDLYDVWVGAPSIAPQLAAADYRMTLLNLDRPRLEGAVAAILAAERLPRVRRREAKATAYDLRPLLIGLEPRPADPAAVPDDASAAEAVAAVGIWMRLRHTQDAGSGRADEVVAAIADALGMVTRSTAPETEDTTGAGAAGSATPPDDAPRPAIELVRPVRERLWLAGELPG